MRRLLAPAAALLLAAGLLSACAPSNQDDFIVPRVPPAKIDVDTPHLRAEKKDAGIEPCKPGAGTTAVDDGLPAVTLPCFGGGREVDLSSLRGPMVLSLWASWCTPCRKEMPILQEFHQKYAGRIAVVGLDARETIPDEAMKLVRASGVTYPLLADPQEELVGKQPFGNLQFLPFLVLVDADGLVALAEPHAITSLDELKTLVHDELGVTP